MNFPCFPSLAAQITFKSPGYLAYKRKWHSFAPNKKAQINPHSHISVETETLTPKHRLSGCQTI